MGMLNSSLTKFLNKIFTYSTYNSLRKCGYGLIKIRMKKRKLFQEEAKMQKTDENVRKTDTVYVNSP